MAPIESAIKALAASKWKLLILWHLRGPVRRFGEVRTLIPRITQKMLAQELRSLEAEGLVQRKLYPVIPPKVEYSLTAHGKTVLPLLDVMSQWGKAHLQHQRAASKPKRARTTMKGENQLMLEDQDGS